MTIIPLSTRGILICLIGSMVGLPGLLTTRLGPQAPAAKQEAVARVVGIFVDAKGSPVAGADIYLSKAFVLERDSQGDYRHAPRLPANPPLRIFAPTGEKRLVVKTDDQGRFEFRAVAAGRYTVDLKRQTKPEAGEGEYEVVSSSSGLVAFDIAAGQVADVGKVFRKSP